MKRVMETASDAVQSLRRTGPARQVRACVRKGLCPVRGKSRQGRAEAVQEDSRRRSSGARCCRCSSKPGIPWITSRILQFAFATAARRRRTQLQLVHRDNPQYNCDEIAVCNLGSINMVAHNEIVGGLSGSTTKNSRRALPRRCGCWTTSIDINYYAVRRRAIQHEAPAGGLGHHGFPGLLQLLRIPYASQEAVEFAVDPWRQSPIFLIGPPPS